MSESDGEPDTRTFRQKMEDAKALERQQRLRQDEAEIREMDGLEDQIRRPTTN